MTCPSTHIVPGLWKIDGYTKMVRDIRDAAEGIYRLREFGADGEGERVAPVTDVFVAAGASE